MSTQSAREEASQRGRRRLDAMNLGCGRCYRPGWINIDAHDGTVADVVANALKLPFTAEALGAIQADHLVEHFDWGRVPYLLSECFRVLRPGGRLVLETPDPEESCRRLLAATSEADREASLAWILGRPSPGYAHRWLFDREGLEGLLADSGFEAIRFEEPQTHAYAPGLRAVAVRSQSTVHRMLAELRSRVPEATLADPDEAREIETRFFANVRASIHPEGVEFLRRFRENAVLSPELCTSWVRLAILHGIWSHDAGKSLLSSLNGLCRAGLHECMDRGFTHLCQSNNTVSDGYEVLFEGAEKLISDCMTQGREVTTSSCLESMGLPPEARMAAEGRSDARRPKWLPEPPSFFTRSRLERLVVGWRDRAVRLLASGRLEEADSLLRRAFNAKLRYFYTAWNLAVLRTTQGDTETAAAYYRVALRFEQAGTETALRRALCLCLLATGEIGEAVAEIDRLPQGPVREELNECIARLKAGDTVALPRPPTEAVPAGREVWW